MLCGSFHCSKAGSQGFLTPFDLTYSLRFVSERHNFKWLSSRYACDRWESGTYFDAPSFFRL
jgi:hypothetical protein